MLKNKLAMLGLMSVFAANATFADYGTPVTSCEVSSVLENCASVASNDIAMQQIIENNASAQPAKKGFFKPWMIAIPVSAAVIAVTGGIAAPFLAGALGAEAAGAATLAAVGSNASYLLPLGAALLL